MTEGLKSSEFWLNALTLVGVLVLLGVGRITVEDVNRLWPLFVGGNGSYTLGRSLVKALRGARMRPEED